MAYSLLMSVCFPLFLLGVPFYFLPMLLGRGAVSGTAYEPFCGRLLLHLAGARPDATAWALAGGLPATNFFYRNLMARPVVWASRVSGYVPMLLRYPAPEPAPMSAMLGARCEFFDRALEEHAFTCPQVVILGAGWDTRAYGLPAGGKVSVFEVDTPGTQVVKRKALEKGGIDASHVVFAPCDFNRESWLDVLAQHGFRRDVRTFLLWEGVTMYLEEAAVGRTLRQVAELPAGSRIAFDFFSREWLLDTVAGGAARWAVRVWNGEPFTFGFPVTPALEVSLGRYLEGCGLALERATPLGAEPPYGGMAVAVRPPGR